MVTKTSPETIAAAMSRDALAVFKDALDDSKEAVQGVLESFVKAIVEEVFKEVQALIETFSKSLPYLTEEQREALKNDLADDILERFINEECPSLEALREAMQKVQRELEEEKFQFGMSGIPFGALEQEGVEGVAWQAAQDAFRSLWGDLRLSRQQEIERGFRQEFQRLAKDMLPV
ncbi:MAG: hypothetical protein A3J68_00855 [Candidatus Wildermuthbacteria bacterium RIFCSPHIGHO2_02_FULL_48_16]|uniref:Uncharacterized protein n=1 Tax=Candidatus Wildermuthbacteria bacterium RIFCSPHIGHO2_02_FULL_48_16 TaxID=1802453 RepID=A0A1G2R8M3_9BACT|nr:MAG: hypothetical protein A3J68_00855 [Candidatus Wildermuthbacteria bacterium RIFCSPHIGHO2_02_FULL_48_16]